MQVRKVLLVEDRESSIKCISAFIRSIFGSNVIVLSARTLKEAEDLFANNSDIDIILMDAHLGGNDYTYELTRVISVLFDKYKPIIAISAEKDRRQKLIEHGCTEECDRLDLLKFLQKYK